MIGRTGAISEFTGRRGGHDCPRGAGNAHGRTAQTDRAKKEVSHDA